MTRAEKGSLPEHGKAGKHRVLYVTEFLPENYVTDGSVSYQAELQQALDTAAETHRSLVFRPMTYLLDDPSGLQVHSNMTLRLTGARFRLAATCQKDGQAFFGHKVSEVRFIGGEIIGQRNRWPESVNIAGIRITGPSSRIHIRETIFRDLSSNAVGIFGQKSKESSDVWITEIFTRNCCNVYRDYLQPDSGKASGSQRKDQGNIALYHVDNFTITGCSLEGSRSDGTHFYKCRNGRFSGNRVLDSKMGGYFLETCRNVLATNNLIRGNGSRGVTIERNSLFCTLKDNIIAHSGREGLWAPDVAGCIVSGNIFRKNGRKDHDSRDSEIKIEERKQWETRTRDLRIEGNLIYTTDHQETAIHVTGGCRNIAIEENTYNGPAEAVRRAK